MVTEQNFCGFYQPNFLSDAQYINGDGDDTDCNDHNLSWLLNYKIELPPIPADVSTVTEENIIEEFPETLTLEFTDLDGNDFDLGNTEIIFTDECEIDLPTPNPNPPPGPSKPPYTYTELIEHALNDKGELTVSGIYQWISRARYVNVYDVMPQQQGTNVREILKSMPHLMQVRDSCFVLQGTRQSQHVHRTEATSSIPKHLLMTPSGIPSSNQYSTIPSIGINRKHLSDHIHTKHRTFTSLLYPEHYPYYKEGDDRWKNSVRHNLSINPHFRKGSKSLHGAGHLWTITEKDASKSWKIVFIPP